MMHAVCCAVSTHNCQPFYLPLHTVLDHSEVAISDDLPNFVFFQYCGGRKAPVAINCKGEMKAKTGNRQVLLFSETRELWQKVRLN